MCLYFFGLKSFIATGLHQPAIALYYKILQISSYPDRQSHLNDPNLLT